MWENKLGVAIIGSGGISYAHVEAYQQFGNQCSIKAVCDVSEERAVRLASYIGKEVEIYKNCKAILSRNDIDIVSICTPPFTHKEVVVEALKHGKHVLCEKPLAASLQECDEMIAASKKYNRKLSIAFQNRYKKDFLQVKHVMESGMLNPITFSQLNALYWRGDSYYEVDWRGKWETECGGATINLEIHLLDIFIWLLGKVDSVYAEMETISHDIDVEDLSMAMLKFADGSIGQVNGTSSSVINTMGFNISGRNKGISIPIMFHALKENEGGFPLEDKDGLKQLEKKANEVQGEYPGHTGPVNDLFQAIKDDREPFVNGEEARRVIEVITAIYKSATIGERVSLPITSNDPWYTTKGLHHFVKKGRVRKV
ncbi:Gfo/Idh/MocA family protein [Lederbergia panacisoli]|uniref:Gfo/Idh/MocA family protein n=1 Tax=Lederbergia panacisoli TaxID=1255251 RepID=UPI00214BFEB1|nr:Gfo/Idh/MocA family oxidoreductase [Lederbergia panacisoli]MCR2821180.1 Gfo/Idh/MocA family oxidoreductase [Lederbergia panacisoli]